MSHPVTPQAQNALFDGDDARIDTELVRAAAGAANQPAPDGQLETAIEVAADPVGEAGERADEKAAAGTAAMTDAAAHAPALTAGVLSFDSADVFV